MIIFLFGVAHHYSTFWHIWEDAFSKKPKKDKKTEKYYNIKIFCAR